MQPFPLESFPITCTAENGAMTPNDSLAVDVSARTFTSVVVFPSTGGIVGTVVGGRGVDVNCGIELGGSVAVTKSGVAVTASGATFTLHPTNRVVIKAKEKMVLKFTQ